MDLNADVGESTPTRPVGDDPGVMRSITSANVAAGFHGGTPSILRETVRLAKAHGVSVGAHPGFDDVEGFGRREVLLSHREVEDLVLYQIAAVAGVAAAEGVRLSHVKPHGALYNMATRDAGVAASIARAVAEYDRALVLFGLAGSQLLAAGRAAGLRVASEGFPDRAYEPDGILMSRAKPGAVITEADEVAARGVRLARDGGVDTLCIHSDTPGAAALAARLRQALTSAGITVAPLVAGRA
jgi:UPF0271 protein